MAKYASMRKMGHLRNDKIYSGNIRLKKSREAGQKQTPQEFCGDLFITGGGRQFYGLLHTTTGNLQGNFKNLPPKAPFPSNHIRLQLNTSVQSPNFSAQNSLKN